jgi:protein-tyrosine phosphatase
MLTKIYWLHTCESDARIGIMARPCGNDWLENEIINLKNNKVGIVVSLLEKEEIKELQLIHEEELCKKNNIIYINFPIPDRDVPKHDNKLEQLIEILLSNLNNGISVVIHCRMGIGRASIIAASVLLKYGFKTDAITNKIIQTRGLKIPDTDQQLAWLKEREKQLKL